MVLSKREPARLCSESVKIPYMKRNVISFKLNFACAILQGICARNPGFNWWKQIKILVKENAKFQEVWLHGTGDIFSDKNFTTLKKVHYLTSWLEMLRRREHNQHSNYWLNMLILLTDYVWYCTLLKGNSKSDILKFTFIRELKIRSWYTFSISGQSWDHQKSKSITAT